MSLDVSDKCGQRRTETRVIVNALKPSFKTKKKQIKVNWRYGSICVFIYFGTVALPLLWYGMALVWDGS